MAAEVTRAQVARALAATLLPQDAAPLAPSGLRGPLPRVLAQKLAECTQPAAVLLPLIERPHGIEILFVEKAPGLKYHGGQIGFPGGRVELDDDSAVSAALRESQEEIGLSPQRVQVAGYLPLQRTLTTRFVITPVVGFVDGAFEAVPDDNEVIGAFEVPLAFFFDPQAARPVRRMLFGAQLETVEYRVGARRIWGATAAILASLTACIERARKESPP